jgi:murein DD-endopeptidase MepM/ murein hydrolase activator NlpD
MMAGLEKSLPDPAIGGVGGLTRLETTSPSADARLSMGAMEKTAEELTARSSRLEAFYQDQKVVLAATPSVWPVRGYLASSFGNRVDPFTGQPDFHPGIDIATPMGTKVQAPADGVVVSTGVKGSYGNAIVIDHGYGVVTRYGHLSGFNVRPGQRVRRGDVLGFVGQTGRATAPHLHYEVWVHDQNLNPIQYILDEYRSFG